MAARVAGWGHPAGALLWQPEPPHTGAAAVGRRLAAGVLLFDGRLVESKSETPWQIVPPDQVWADHLHGHGWLDDAVAASDERVWTLLNEWLWDWIEEYGDGSGPGWRPELVARRLMRWLAYSVRILRRQEQRRSAAFFQLLNTQSRFLAGRWRQTRPGAERIEALSGLVYALISLEGRGVAALRAIGWLGSAADQAINAHGEGPSRNPEELARILSLLVWIAGGVEDAGLEPSPKHISAIQRAAPNVRALLRGDGTLARFHGGRGGNAVELARIIERAQARGPVPMPPGDVMGFTRLKAADSLAIIDTALPARHMPTPTGHSSGLSFEFSSGNAQIIVNCGSGLGFGVKPARSARRRPAYSSIDIEDACPARLRPGGRDNAEAMLTCTGQVSGRRVKDASGIWALCESTEYVSEFGLVVERRMHLSKDGNRLSGEDTVLATTAETRARIAEKFPSDAAPCRFAARFHLHPDISASLVMSGRTAALTLQDDSRWLMRVDADQLGLEPSQYFDENRPNPRATKQIVVRARLMDYWGRITWVLERLQDGRSPLSPTE